ncbi:MAG: hypothetical protein ACKOK8_12185 [Planctomycetia bacterium]
MRICRPFIAVLVAGIASTAMPTPCAAQCCLSELFAGCRKAPAAYAVAPIAAPIVAPVAAPIPAPPPPVVVPVQQVSYVPETTYRTQYQCVPVTSYKPSSEIDPCTGCPRECMEQVTQYVQQAVNVPVTQYRAVYSTKYVQMQPGYSAAGTYGTPGAATAQMMAPASAGAATSPFASTVQTTPQAWGAAGADVPQQLIQPGQPQTIGAPALAPAMVPQQGLQQPVYQQPAYQQPAFQQPVVPQSGTYAVPAPSAVQPQPTAPPTLSPTPSLRPIPDLQRTPAGNGAGAVGSTQSQATTGPSVSGPATPQTRTPANGTPAPALTPFGGSGNGTGSGLNGGTSTSGSNGMPVLPGVGPGAATGAVPKLLEPTGHTTSWQPGATAYPFAPARPSAYPTAALPGRVQ